jgi:hypothetical protein
LTPEKFRPTAAYWIMAPVPEDEMEDRTIMEASEHNGLPAERGGGGLKRIDPVRVTQTLGSPERAGGYARLEMMLNAVLPRLVGDGQDPRSASS